MRRPLRTPLGDTIFTLGHVNRPRAWPVEPLMKSCSHIGPRRGPIGALAAPAKLAPILLAFGLMTGAGSPAWAQQASTTVNRCEADGRIVFQQAPCLAGQRASQVVVPPAPANVVSAPARRAAPEPASTPAETAPAASPLLAAPLPPAEDAACLTYLKPLLRDPPSARILSSSREGRVWRVKLQAADAQGRLHTRDAACEFINGRVDDGWSRIQLKRLGWLAPPVLVQGTGREARRAARELESSIEAPAL